MSDRKPTNKLKTPKLAKVLKTIETVRLEVSNFQEKWSEKFNEVSRKFQNFVPAVAQQFAQHQAHMQINSQSIDKLDLQQQAIIKMFGNTYEVLELLREITNVEDQADEMDLEGIKVRGRDTFNALARSCFDQVHEERKAREEARKAAEEAAKKKAEEDAAEAEKAKKEAEQAEEALRSAEDAGQVVEGQGGPGTKIPEGAEVFGG